MSEVKFEYDNVMEGTETKHGKTGFFQPVIVKQHNVKDNISKNFIKIQKGYYFVDDQGNQKKGFTKMGLLPIHLAKEVYTGAIDLIEKANVAGIEVVENVEHKKEEKAD